MAINMINININGREIKCHEGQTILEAAKKNGIEIPTLCHDDRVKTYGACGICVVEVENSPKLIRACSTIASDGLVVKTDTPRAEKARRAALELLLSDHTGDCRPPCVTACPGHTDCQGYVGLIANGQYYEAVELIKDKLPLPSSIGRVCPHPCEKACRRQMVEEPVSIAQLKYFASDLDLRSENVYIPAIKSDTHKKINVIGGGPGGLTAAYFLRIEGHDVTVYDAMPKMGGMLRYGIPEYRLPKAILDAEIDIFRKMGIRFVNNVKIGGDLSFTHLLKTGDAVVLAIGAWSSIRLGCPGEDLPGVLGGIDFLRDVATDQGGYTGRRIAVVGGGNTAMDACRTAVRLGAQSVYNIYRRTKTEMPAESIEIQEAEEEGVIFKYLTNPIEILGDGEKVNQIRLQKMELGEPDASGRCVPVPIAGAEEIINVDTVIIAVGQRVNSEGFHGIELTKRKTIAADEGTFQTNLEKVFAIGDATNQGAGIAIEAIGEARKVAGVIDSFLRGEKKPFQPDYLVEREVTAEMFADREKIPREKMPHATPEQRKTHFGEVNQGYTEAQAQNEAQRCLECGCADYFECKLIDYANQYRVKPGQYDGETHNRAADVSNPFFYRNPDKCILCGLCVRVCDEVMGRTALGLVGRGFDTLVKPAMGLPIADTDCISCGQCVNLCPTGALGERLALKKPVPISIQTTHSVCTYCSVGCQTKTASKGSMWIYNRPDEDADPEALLCVKGRFGYGELQKDLLVRTPLIRRNGKLTEALPEEVLPYVTKRALGIATQYGADSLAVTVSDRYTNEEIFIIREYAEKVLKTKNIGSFHYRKSGLRDVLGYDASTNSLDELLHTDVILLFCDDIINSHTMAGIRIKKAVENGAKLILISRKETQADEWAFTKLNPSDNLDILKQMTKALINLGKSPKQALGFDELSKALGMVEICDDIARVMRLYAGAKKAILVFEQNAVTTDTARMLANIAVISGHIGSARSGIIQLKPNNNSQGLSDMGVSIDGEQLSETVCSGSVKALLVFGEDIPHLDLSGVQFLMVQDCLMTETAEKAEVVLPGVLPYHTDGTYTGSDRRIQKNRTFAAGSDQPLHILYRLCEYSGLPYKTPADVRSEIAVRIPEYANMASEDDQNKVWPGTDGFVLYSDGFHFPDQKARLTMPEDNIMYAESANTNAIYNRFMHYLDQNRLLK